MNELKSETSAAVIRRRRKVRRPYAFEKRNRTRTKNADAALKSFKNILMRDIARSREYRDMMRELLDGIYLENYALYIKAISDVSGANHEVAVAWFRSQKLPAFGNMTPLEVVRDGSGDAFRSYLNGMDAGVYA